MRYIWAFLVCLVILFSLTPTASLLWLLRYAPNDDKLLHLLAYVPLAFLPVISFRTTPHKLQALLFVLTLGYVLELAQSQVPGRHYDHRDMLANTAGIATGALLGLLLRAVFQTSHKPKQL